MAVRESGRGGNVSALSLRSVEKGFGIGDARVIAVSDVTLTLGSGEMLAVMGPSGCGKSTLLTLCGGLQPVDAGSIRVADVEITDMGDKALQQHRLRTTSFIFQNYNLIDLLNVEENVRLPLELAGRSRKDANRIGRGALDLVDMAGLSHRMPATLSGGQQQRVAIARALASGSQLILADEPTGALDSHNSGQVMNILERVVAEGTSVVVATHDAAVAGVARRIIQMRDGALSPPPDPA